MSAPSRPSNRGTTRRSLLKLAGASAVLPAASALTGCGGGSSGGPQGAKEDELSLVYLGDATQQKVFNKLFDKFTESHPDIKIKPKGIPSGDWASFANTVSTQIAGGNVPDIVDVATEGQQLFAEKKLLEPLDSYIKKDKKETDAYFSGIDSKLLSWTKKHASPDGKTYFIPGGYNTSVMYCNTEVFKRAGVPLPDPDWTWDEFERAGRRIKDKTGAYLTGVGWGFPFVDILPWLLTNGTSTLDADWKKATFDSPEAVEAVTFLKRLLKAGLSPKPGGSFDAPSAYAKGKLATLGGGRWPTLDIQRLKMVDKTQIVNWPTKEGKGSPVGWDGWPIMKASKKKDKAWTFLLWMMSKEAGEYYAQIGGTNVPALRSVAAGPAFTKGAPEGTALIAKAITYGSPIPSPVKGSEVQTAVTKGWQAALTGTSSVESALERANRQIQGLL